MSLYRAMQAVDKEARAGFRKEIEGQLAALVGADLTTEPLPVLERLADALAEACEALDLIMEDAP